MRTNTKNLAERPRTHEGAPVRHTSDEAALRRSVMSCLLWEDGFYEDGQTIADRIVDLCGKVTPETIASLAVEARSEMNLRHVPLLLLRELVKHGTGRKVAETIAEVIQRPDEMGELLSLYWADGRKPIAKQLKVGLALALAKFDEYSLAKNDGNSAAVSVRDVMFLSHAKPLTPEREALYARIASNTMATPDTWETNLSAGADKGETFTRLLQEGKLGYMALLRNLRNMSEANVSAGLISEAIEARKGAHRVLPFRFLTAANAAPRFTAPLDRALVANLKDGPRFKGTTVVCVDTSASMRNKVSGRSEIQCVEAAAVLASCIYSDEVRTLNFASTVEEVKHFYGLAGVEVITGSIGAVGHGTDIGAAVRAANALKPDRIIVVSDMQSRSGVQDPGPGVRGYMLNVASNKNAVGYGPWTQIDGFSEAVLRYMAEQEA